MQNIIPASITATELVRNLSLFIDQVRISGQSLYITKGSQTVAELSPAPKVGYPINRLADLLNTLPKLNEEAQAMSDDIKQIKQSSNLPESPWD